MSTTELDADPPRGRKRTRQADWVDAQEHPQGQEAEQETEQEEEQGHAHAKRRKHRRHQKTRAAAVEDMASKGPRRAADSQSPFANRPKLQPTPPSTLSGRSRSRSSSPVRISIRAMETGNPSVRLEMASDSSSVTGQPPAVVDAFIDALVQDSGCAIPASIRGLFQARYPRVARQTPESAFSTDPQLYAWRGGDEALWARVLDLEQRANKCFRKHMDEAAWCAVVQHVLQLALDVAGSGSGAADFALEFHAVQTQAVNVSFLPQIRKAGQLQPVDKRTDFTVAVDLDVGHHVPVDQEQLPLSPMTDAYTATLPLVCGLEVKRLDGSEEEAQLQLMVWQASMLAHLEHLRDLGGNHDLPLPPVVAWTVTNHSWKLYIAWKQPDGGVRVTRPFAQSTPASTAGTENVPCIFILLKLWTRLIAWIKTDYYPAYRALLQQAVLAQGAAPTTLVS